VDNIVNIISNVGFPIFMAVYLTMRVETTIKELTQAITKLIERLDRDDKD